MGILLSIIIIIVSVLLGLIVLIQNPKGGGLATGFTGVSSIGGVKRTTDFLEKATWSLAIAIFVLCIFATSQMSNGSTISEDIEDAPTEVINMENIGIDDTPAPVAGE